MTAAPTLGAALTAPHGAFLVYQWPAVPAARSFKLALSLGCRSTIMDAVLGSNAEAAQAVQHYQRVLSGAQVRTAQAGRWFLL